MNPYTVSPDLNGEGLHLGIVRAVSTKKSAKPNSRPASPSSPNLGSTSATSWSSRCPAPSNWA